MIPWEKRPHEVAHLLNPAFCGLLLRDTVVSYTRTARIGLPFALSFLVLPIVLHRTTRDLLPRAFTTSLLGWLQEHPEVRIGFADRTRALIPFTQEAHRFMLMRSILQIDAEGRVRVGTKLRRSTDALAGESEDLSECLRRAQLIGRWFVQAGTEQTIFRLWGITP